MRSRFMLLFLVVAVTGCQDKKPDSPAGPGTAGTGTGTGAGDGAGAPPATGAINGKPFTPDQVALEGKTLAFRKGKDFFPEMEIRFDLPEGGRGKLEGREWSFTGGKFENPTVLVAVAEGKDVPKTEFVWPTDYTMTVKVTKQGPKSIEGVIDLKVTKPANTHLAGAFTATVKKSLEDPLDAEDAPYIQGRILFAGPWTEAKLTAGFAGTGADGKDHSNIAGVTLSPKGGGSATSLTFQPQLTSLFSHPTDGPSYRHTKVPPGEYVVFVRRDEVVAAWKRVTVKAGDGHTIDLTIEPGKTGELAVTIPDEEANEPSEWHLSLIPAGLDLPSLNHHFAFNAAEVKKGQKSVTVKGVPAGKYRALRGKSEAEVEVVAGKSTPVTLVRTDPDKKKG